METNVALIDRTLPRPLQIAHWLHGQQRLVSAREAAGVLGGSAWAMEQQFSKVRQLSSIVVIDEQWVPSRGGRQYLMRVVHIYPYWLDEHRCPHRQQTGLKGGRVLLTWRDLVCRQWAELVKMQEI